MRALLDTHTVLWWLYSPGFLGRNAYDHIAVLTNEMLIFSSVPWEIAIKANKHQQVPHLLVTDFHRVVRAQGFTVIGIDPPHAIRSGLLPSHHKDPFDRLLAAQALEMNVPLISRDSVFDTYGVERVW